MFLPLFENTCACLKCCLYLFGDCVHFCVFSLLDASVAEEDIEGEFYQEEDYPGDFANQGKPSFESYSKCLALLLHSTCFK
jgi:hypothetical protein